MPSSRRAAASRSARASASSRAATSTRRAAASRSARASASSRAAISTRRAATSSLNVSRSSPLTGSCSRSARSRARTCSDSPSTSLCSARAPPGNLVRSHSTYSPPTSRNPLKRRVQILPPRVVENVLRHPHPLVQRALGHLVVPARTLRRDLQHEVRPPSPRATTGTCGGPCPPPPAPRTRPATRSAAARPPRSTSSCCRSRTRPGGGRSVSGGPESHRSSRRDAPGSQPSAGRRSRGSR